MARRALGLRARGAGRLAFEINGRPKTEPGLQARSPFCLHCLSMNQNGPLRLRSGPFLRKGITQRGRGGYPSNCDTASITGSA